MLKILAKRKVKKFKCIYAYMCVCIVYVLNSQSPNCCSSSYLTIDLSYSFSLYFFLPSVHLRGESFWWHKFQPCCPRVWRAPAHALQCRCLGSEHGCDTRLAANTRLAGDRLSILRARKRARKGGIQGIRVHTRGKTHVLTFWTFIQVPHSTGRCASCWRCKCKHRRGICFTPTDCSDIHACRAKFCSGILTCDALSWATSTRPGLTGSCKRPRELRAKFHPRTRTATPEHGACCRCAPGGSCGCQWAGNRLGCTI